MKVAAFFLLITVAPVSHAEGVASMTTVTAANGKALEYHGLAVACTSQNGRTFVDLVFRPGEETPFQACSVTIYDQTGKKILMQMDPKISRARGREGLPDGSRVQFHVADELLDAVEIMYHLEAGEIQSHVFTIRKGELRKLAGLL